MTVLFRLLFLFLIGLAGCQQKMLYVYEQTVDAKYLASTNVGSPDPRKPPKGQLVVAEWWLPKTALAERPVLRIHTLFKNYSEDCVEYPIETRIGSKAYWVINQDFERTCGILAYRAEILSCDGQCLASWQHQLFVKLIDIDDASDLSNAAVSG